MVWDRGGKTSFVESNDIDGTAKKSSPSYITAYLLLHREKKEREPGKWIENPNFVGGGKGTDH